MSDGISTRRTNMHPLPDLYLVGAPKAGTTSLTRWLEGRPEVFFSQPKESYFWSYDYPRMRAHRGYDTRDSYESLYASEAAKKADRRADGSTTYLYSETAVPSILEEVPEAQFVVTLRNPVDLLLSWHRTQLIALNEDEVDFGSAWRRSLSGVAPDTDMLDSKRVDYPMMGRLGAAVQKLLDVAPPGSVHFVGFDDLANRPMVVWEELTKFLDIPVEPVPAFKAYNASDKMYRSALVHRLKHRPPALLAGPMRAMREATFRISNPTLMRMRELMWRAQEKPVVDASLRVELQTFFADDVALLGQLLDWDLSGWQQPE